MKRLFDICASASGLLVLSPVLMVVLFLVWRQDHHSPLFKGARVAKGGGVFTMYKVRSMVINADKTGVESTGAADNRITPLGHFIRRWKIDEITQLWNVLLGDMSLVGPRPNTVYLVSRYTPRERGLLNVRPGITDLSSIVFSDEGEIIKNYADADDAYNQLIRPWKSELGLIYAKNAGVLLDIRLILLTMLAIFDKPRALSRVEKELKHLGATDEVISVARRDKPLLPSVFAR